MRHTTRLLHLLSLFAASGLIAGCEPSPPSQEGLGRIVFNESEVPGANESYELPERLRKLEAAQKNDGHPPGE